MLFIYLFCICDPVRPVKRRVKTCLIPSDGKLTANITSYCVVTQTSSKDLTVSFHGCFMQPRTGMGVGVASALWAVLYRLQPLNWRNSFSFISDERLMDLFIYLFIF